MTSAKQTTNQHTRHLSYTPTGQIQSIKDEKDEKDGAGKALVAEYQYKPTVVY